MSDTTPRPVDFYFDFSSPYGYLASMRIDELCERHGRSCNWHPILLGAIFKINGQAPLTTIPLKGDYAVMDFARAAREHGVSFSLPPTFPIASIAACRTSYWLTSHADSNISAQAKPFMKAVMKSYYEDHQDISQADVVIAAAESVGIDAATLQTALGEQSIKDLLRVAMDAAVERKVFGSPTFFVDDEQFWGNDRLEQIDRWLERGGW